MVHNVNGQFFKYEQGMVASQLKIIVIFIRFDCAVIHALYQYIQLQQQQYMSATIHVIIRWAEPRTDLLSGKSMFIDMHDMIHLTHQHSALRPTV